MTDESMEDARMTLGPSVSSNASRSRSMRLRPFSSDGMSTSFTGDQGTNELMSLSEVSYLKIFTLLRDKDWVSVREALQYDLAESQMRDESGLSLLGMAVGCKAPLDIIKMIKELNPNFPRMKDCFDALPLHIACLNGASIDTLNVLLSDDVDTVMWLDAQDRSPLHNAVQYACGDFDPEEELLRLSVLDFLCKLAPEAVRVFDTHGFTPIDLAQNAKMEMMVYGTNDFRYLRLEQIYSILSAANIALYKKEKQMYEMKPHYMLPEKAPEKDTDLPTTRTDDITSSSNSYFY